VILASASSYFRALFCTNYAEKNQDLIVIRQINSTALQLLIDFIYSGIVTVTENNVKVIIYKLDFV